MKEYREREREKNQETDGKNGYYFYF